MNCSPCFTVVWGFQKCITRVSGVSMTSLILFVVKIIGSKIRGKFSSFPATKWWRWKELCDTVTQSHRWFMMIKQVILIFLLSLARLGTMGESVEHKGKEVNMTGVCWLCHRQSQMSKLRSLHCIEDRGHISEDRSVIVVIDRCLLMY